VTTVRKSTLSRPRTSECEPAWSVGAFCGNADVNLVSYAIDRANDWGFDAIEIGTVLAMYVEYSECGYANGVVPESKLRELEII
jgi:aldehyde:ferredoxin oxidoreductase